MQTRSRAGTGPKSSFARIDKLQWRGQSRSSSPSAARRRQAIFDPRAGCGFTYGHLRDALSFALDAGYEFVSFPEAVHAGAEAPQIALRHDVDHSPDAAVALARVEAELGIRATYFVLPTGEYNLLGQAAESIRSITQLGHWLGIHYDPSAYLDQGLPYPGTVHSDAAMLASRFSVPVEVAARHNPTSGRPVEADIAPLLDAYDPRLRERFRYLSDSCQHWREGCFCQAITDPARPSLQVLIHAEWWSADGAAADIILSRIEGERIARATEDHRSTRALFAGLEHLPTRHLFATREDSTTTRQRAEEP